MAALNPTHLAHDWFKIWNFDSHFNKKKKKLQLQQHFAVPYNPFNPA